MLSFLMQRAVDGKRRVVLVIDPVDIDRMKQGRPISVDLSQDDRNKVPVIIVAGFTPDRRALQQRLDEVGGRYGRYEAEDLLNALEECKELPERHGSDGGIKQ